MTEVHNSMSAAHDSYVEDNFEHVLDAFKDCQWETVLQNLSHGGHASISEALHKAATEANNEGYEARSRVLRLLAEVYSMMLSSDEPNDPFEPLIRINGSRSTIPDDFTDSEIKFFAKIIDSIDSPMLKGRLADLVWLKGHPRDVKFALSAIDSYLQIPLDVDTWFGDGEDCWKRAISLCRMIGPTVGDRLTQIETSIINALSSVTAEEKFFGHALADILTSSGLGKSNSKAVAEKLESLADQFNDAGDFHLSGRFYSTASEWFSRSGDDDKSIDMTVAEAGALVNEATSRLSSDSPSHGVAASFLEDAVQVYRRVPRNSRNRHGVDKLIQELRLRITEYGKRALDEMVTVSGPPIDVTESIEQARNAVSGRPVLEALKAFADLHTTSAKQLRESAIDSLSHSAFLASIPKVVSSHDGRKIAKTPGISSSVPSDYDEEEIRSEMNRFHYGTQVSVVVQAVILPALDVLNLEHRLREADLIDLARRSPIVPAGREVLVGKALAQGFGRDFATSIHLLAPQIEHMVRIPLKYAGINTSLLDQDGIETEKGLSALIDLPETTAIFGEDLTYEIKALFCDQMGPNLRNNIAHGLLNDREAHSVDAIYAWWLGLKLVFNTFWNSLDRGSVEEQQEEASAGDSVSG